MIHLMSHAQYTWSSFLFSSVYLSSLPQTCRRPRCRWLSRSQGSLARRTGPGCRLAAPSVVKDVIIIIIIIITIFINVLQGSTNCSILPSRVGEHGEHRERREHGKDGQHQADHLKHSFWQPDDSKHIILQLLCRRSKNHNKRAWRT